MERAAKAAILLVALAIPKSLLAQQEAQQYIPLDSFPMPVNPGEISELRDRGLLKVWVPASKQTVQVREAERGQKTETVEFWLFVNEEGELAASRARSQNNDEALVKTIEAALPKMKFRPGMYRGKPAGAWVRLEFVFLNDGEQPWHAFT